MLLDNDDHSVASVANVVVQVRRGQLTNDVLESIIVFSRAARVRSGGAFGILSILEPQAPMPAAEVRKRQKELVSVMLSDANTYQALVLLGDSPTVSAQRAIARTTPHSFDSQFTFHAEIEPAILWMSKQIKTDAQLLRATIERLRRVSGK